MIPYVEARPSPTPIFFSLVVKKGSKIRFWVSFSIPAPLSPTENLRIGRPSSAMSKRCSHRVSYFQRKRTKSPPPGMACQAFTYRFRSACSICPRSTSTVQRPCWEVSLNMDLLSVRPNISELAMIKVERSVGCTSYLPPRANPRSWLVSFAPRLTISSISRGSRSGLPHPFPRSRQDREDLASP